AADELGIADRRRPDDDARGAGLGERLSGVEVADPAARLDLHGEAVRDGADVVEVLRRAGARAVEIDDVEPFGAFGDELPGRLERRRGDLLRGLEVAPRHADGLTLIDVDRRVDDHQIRGAPPREDPPSAASREAPPPRDPPSTESAKARRSRSPSAPDFSGWNCPPSTLQF